MTPQLSEKEYLWLHGFISQHIGLDYGPTRRELLQSRLRRRLEQCGLSSFEEYCKYLQRGSQRTKQHELESLAELLTNHETYFFRESQQFELLFGPLWPSLPAPSRKQILSAGCASGEEAYSLAIYAQEHRVKVDVIGFDLCDSPLQRAKSGRYRANSFRSPLTTTQERYFLEHEHNERSISPVLQRDVLFRHGNLLDRDWLYHQGRFAVIFCRNVLIYFEEQAFQHAISTLYELLLPGGLLFLSTTESLLARQHSFEVVQQDRMLCYRRPR